MQTATTIREITFRLNCSSNLRPKKDMVKQILVAITIGSVEYHHLLTN